MASRRVSLAPPPMSPTKSSGSTRGVSPGRGSPATASLTSPSLANMSPGQSMNVGPNPMVGPSASCFGNIRSFVRVRPFKDAEGSTKPPDQIVPRPVLTYDGRTLTILDPKTFKGAFKTPKLSTLESENILWSFVDPLETEVERRAANRIAPAIQADVYLRAVEPVFPSILEGYGAAFVVLGANDTGKDTTMFGDEKWSDGNKGIFPRFVEDLFVKLKEYIRGDTVLTYEVSAVEIPTAVKEEKYIDLFNKKGGENLRVTDTESEGLILENITRVKCLTAEDVIENVRKTVKPLRNRKTSTYAVTLHICQTTTYKNKENAMAPPKILSRRSAISFSVVRNVLTNAPFARCVDSAGERDTGANAKSKPPTRDNCWTRLFADIFLQKLNVTMINCISPFYDHAKDDAAMLEIAKKLGDIKTAACLRADESEVEYRRLADEIHTLDSEVTRTEQAIDVIQKEIDRCHAEYEEASTQNSDAWTDCHTSKTALKAFDAFKKREITKGAAAVAAEKKIVAGLEGNISDLKAETKATLDATDGVRKERQNADDRIAKIQGDIDKQKAGNGIFEAELKIYRDEEKDVKDKEAFIANAAEGHNEAKLQLVQQTVALKSAAPALKAEATKAEDTYAEQKEKEDAISKNLAAQRAKKQALDNKKAELARIKAEIAKTQKEIDDMNKDCDTKEEEIKNAPKGCCVIM